MTDSSSSTDLHQKGSAFPAILPKLTILSTRYEEIYSFLLMLFFQLKAYYYRNVYSERLLLWFAIFHIWVIIKLCSAVATISSKSFIAPGMTPNLANTISKHGQMLWRSLSEDLCNSRKLKKVVAIYKTNKLVLSKK